MTIPNDRAELEAQIARHKQAIVDLTEQRRIKKASLKWVFDRYEKKRIRCHIRKLTSLIGSYKRRLNAREDKLMQIDIRETDHAI